jgi:ubiquinone/menaquinone biosynthesis C-methylase UbiE
MGNSETPLYDHLGTGYDITRRADPYISNRLADHLAIVDSGRYLDVACGTGNYTIALAARGGRWHGIDQSRRMIQSAQQKSEHIAWYQADATTQPFCNEPFSGAICTCALHHFDALGPAFSEIYRIMGHGQFVMFTAAPEQMSGYWLNEYFPDAMNRSIEQMPSLNGVLAALSGAGFQLAYTESYEVQPDLHDFFLYSGKHRPEMYLSEAVRRGISTFTSLADPSEVRVGCGRLRKDIESGHIAEVIKAYSNTEGDYLFIVAAKVA